MQAVGQLSPQAWLCHPDTQAVMAALTAKGATARFAGGCVRDAVLHLPVHDIDIAIDCPPSQTVDLLQTAGIRVVPTGLSHGTVTAVMSVHNYEVTSLRRDVETDGRHAVVAFTSDWQADAARRDLTINALFADLDGMIYDPFDGLADLGAGRVRFVGDPEQRIAEDALRLLRFFRFYGRYGSPPADVAALAACRKMAAMVANLSGERVRDEMIKIFSGADPGEVLLLMRGEGVTPYVLPGPLDMGRLRVLSWLETRGVVAAGVQADPLRRLAAVLQSNDSQADVERAGVLASAWRLSNHDRSRLIGMMDVRSRQVLSVQTSADAARQLLYELGDEAYRDHVLLAWADYRHSYGVAGPLPGAQGTQAWDTLLHLPESAPVPPFPITGADVVAQGVAPGPWVGTVLRQLEQIWRDAGFSPSRADLLQRIPDVVRRNTS